MKIYNKLTGLVLSLLLLNACYDDQGNYDYHPINDVVISDAGFKSVVNPSKDSIYKKISFKDTLKISPVISASLQADLSKYEYEWVAGNKKLGNSKDLNYFVELPTGSYSIAFKMKDLSTGIVYIQSTSLEVSDMFSIGWIVLGEDNDGYAQLDMVATPYDGDTVVLKNVTLDKGLPKLKGPKLLFHGSNRKQILLLSTEEGSYLLDRTNYSSGPEYSFKTMFLESSFVDKAVTSDIVQFYANNRSAIVDGKAFCATSFGEGDEFDFPVNRYKGKFDYFKVGDKIGVNYSKSSNYFIYYNTDAKRFVSGFYTQSYCDSLIDASSKDPFSWKTGLDYVTTINSRYLGGHSHTILKDNTGKYYLYSYLITNGIAKKAKYELSNATNIAQAKFYGHSNDNTYLFYTVGSQLYGYDYVRKAEHMLKDFGEEITCYWHQIYSPNLYTAITTDNFYIATCDASKPKSTCGTLTGFKVLKDVNKIVIEPIVGESWDGLCKVVSISYRNN